MKILFFVEVPVVIILTHIDEICPKIRDEGPQHVFNSRAVGNCVSNVRHRLGVNEGMIFPVQNYRREVATNPEIDKLALIACLNILQYAAAYIDKTLQAQAQNPNS